MLSMAGNTPIRGSFDGCLYTIPVLGRDLRGLCPAELRRCNPRTALVSRASYDVDVPVHSLLCCCCLGYVFAERNSYDLVIILDSSWRRHHVWPDGGSVFAELHMSLYDPCRWECRQLLALDQAVLRTPKFFRLFLTFSYCLYDFLREQELGTGGSPITDRTACFHEENKRSRYHGTMGIQASRELGEGDMRLRVTRLLSPIRGGSPRKEIGKHFQNRFYLRQ